MAAAYSIKVVVASFMSDGLKELKLANQFEPSFAMTKFAHELGTTRPSSTPSCRTLSESSSGLSSTHNQSTGAYNNNNL